MNQNAGYRRRSFLSVVCSLFGDVDGLFDADAITHQVQDDFVAFLLFTQSIQYF